MGRNRIKSEMIEKTRLVLDLSRRIARAHLSWDAAATSLGLNNTQLARLLTYRFRQLTVEELRRFVDCLAPA